MTFKIKYKKVRTYNTPQEARSLRQVLFPKKTFEKSRILKQKKNERLVFDVYEEI